MIHATVPLVSQYEALYPLPRLIGLCPARWLIFSGEIIGPEEALRLGLVDYLVPTERFADGVAELLAGYLRAPHTALIASKRLTARPLEAPLETVYEEALPLLAECLASPEAAAARKAWQRRRIERDAT